MEPLSEFKEGNKGQRGGIQNPRCDEFMTTECGSTAKIVWWHWGAKIGHWLKHSKLESSDNCTFSRKLRKIGRDTTSDARIIWHLINLTAVIEYRW